MKQYLLLCHDATQSQDWYSNTPALFCCPSNLKFHLVHKEITRRGELTGDHPREYVNAYSSNHNVETNFKNISLCDAVSMFAVSNLKRRTGISSSGSHEHAWVGGALSSSAQHKCEEWTIAIFQVTRGGRVSALWAQSFFQWIYNLELI